MMKNQKLISQTLIFLFVMCMGIPTSVASIDQEIIRSFAWKQGFVPLMAKGELK